MADFARRGGIGHNCTSYCMHADWLQLLTTRTFRESSEWDFGKLISSH